MTSSDTTPPSVNCGTADGQWHAANATISCTASDSGTGLANASDSSFTLSTSVAAGQESSNAQTGTHAGLRSSAELRHGRPDRGQQSRSRRAERHRHDARERRDYITGQSITADYACTDGGSGVSTCQGTVADGAALDTSSTGSKSFAVTTTDDVGNGTTRTVSYSVIPADSAAPAISCGFADILAYDQPARLLHRERHGPGLREPQ